MTVEELIEALRAMPPTSIMDIETKERYETPVNVRYEQAITYIECEEGEEREL